ncbi:MAG: hypothetical protein WC848_02170 [Parcubacteria group bacterium]|jgi:hypothetical protein
MLNKVNKVREIAHRQIAEKYCGNHKDAVSLLRNFPFYFSTDQNISQLQIATYNLELDGRGCLGKVAQAGAVVEKEFPEVKLMLGEVLEDFFCNILLDILKKDPDQPDSFFEELLMYEEPHSVLVVDGKQFEPLSIPFERDVSHPKIKALPFWEAVTASRLISMAWLEKNPYRKIRILAEAEKICPGMIATKENLSSYLLLVDEEREAIKLAEETLSIRPTARSMYFLYLLTKDKKYIELVETKYSPVVVHLLEKEVMQSGR